MSDTTVIICLYPRVEKGILRRSESVYYVALATKRTQLRSNAFKESEEDEPHITNENTDAKDILHLPIECLWF